MTNDLILSTMSTHRLDVVARVRVRRPAPPVAASSEPTIVAGPAVPPEMTSLPLPPASPSPPLPANDVPEPEPYRVGYKRPPRHSQFAKGETGNRKGRPKGAKGLKTIVRKILTEKVVVRSASGSQRMTKMEALVHKTTEQGFAGNMRAILSAMQLYEKSVPDEPVTMAQSQAVPIDMDAHDHAILKALQRSLRDEDDES